jgi:hypothetical protein
MSSSINGLAKAIKGFVISDGDGEVSALENCVTAACPGLFKLKPVKTTVGRLRTELMQELGESSSEGERDDFMQHFVVHFLERKEFLARTCRFSGSLPVLILPGPISTEF